MGMFAGKIWAYFRQSGGCLIWAAHTVLHWANALGASVRLMSKGTLDLPNVGSLVRPIL